jgi:hypothetical protein
MIFISSCSESIEKKNFNFFLNEPCMIVNYEQDNTIEGKYLIAEAFQIADSTLKMKLPENFYVNNLNCRNWNVGWGTNKPLSDAGSENIRAIEKIDTLNNIIYIGKLLRGSGFPERKQRIVFWNTKPTGFYNFLKKPIINPSIWSEFSGKSIHFGSIEFDSSLNKWIMIVNEADTNKIQTYAAMSDNLTDWEAANKGIPILKASDFKDCKWAGKDKEGKVLQTPYVSDILRYNNKWYLFLNGYSIDGKRHIGFAVSKATILGPYEIEKEPVISPGGKNSWNDEACFYAKVKRFKNNFIMFYDGRNHRGYETIGMATSRDLIKWDNFEKNPVLDQHTGWRSLVGTTEPSFIEIRNDSIWLMVEGVKKLKAGPFSHYITRRMYMDVSGNVADTELGIYLSVDGGKTFTAHKNNPVFVNDYSNIYENDHLGGNFKLIKTDTADFIIYQGKSIYQGSKYNILLRKRGK